MFRLLADSRVTYPTKYSLISVFRPPLRYSSSSIVNLQATASKNDVHLMSKVIVEEKAKKSPKDVSNQELSSLATFIPPEGTTSEPLSVTTTPIQTQQHDLQDTDDTDVHELLFQSRKEARIRILRKLLAAKNPSEVQSVLSSDYFYSKKYQSYIQSEKEAKELLERLKWFQEQGFNINSIFLKSLKLSIKTMSFRKKSLEEFGIDVNNYGYLHGEVFLKIMLTPIVHVFGPEAKKFRFFKTKKQIKTVDSLTPNQVINEILKKYHLMDCFSHNDIADLIRLPIGEVRYRIINEAVRKKFGDKYKHSFQDVDMRIPTPLSEVMKTLDILSRDKHCMENLEHINFSLVVSRLSPELLEDFLTRYPFFCHRHVSRYFGNSYIAMFVRGVDSLKESVDFMVSLKVDPYRLAHFPNLFLYKPSTLRERAKYWLNAFGPDAFRNPRITDLIQTHEMSVVRFQNLFKKTPTTIQNLFESHSTVRRRVMAGKRKMLEAVCCRFKIDFDLFQSSLHRHPHFNQEKIFEDSTVEMFSLLIEQEGFSANQVAQSGALVMFSVRDVKKTLKEVDVEQGLSWRSLESALDQVLYRLDNNSAVQLGKPFLG